MLTAEAYSFRHKSRLAISLSWVAGYTNVIILIAAGQTISHQTGNTTHLGRGLGELLGGDVAAAADVGLFGFLVGTFWLGAVSSGFLIEFARRSGRASRYVLPITLEAILLSLLWLAMLVWRHPADGGASLFGITGLAGFAMGLQNATITRISGAIVRTTHLTGVVTDLGLESVQLLMWWRDMVRRRHHPLQVLRLARRQSNAQRVALLGSIWGSFVFGATLGTVAFNRLGPGVLIAPVLFLGYIVLQATFKPIADVREIDPTRDGDLSAGDSLPLIKSMLPPHVGMYRLAHHRTNRRHHAPDFGGWAERVPRHWQTIILVISPMTQFDLDTAASLLAAVRQLHDQHRALIITGMNPTQFRTLRDCGVADVIGLEDFMPDLEMAVARAISRAGA